jgi:hypothetical protein
LEGVVRKGKVKAEQPTLITPTYAMNLKGFSDEAYKYFSQVAHLYGANSPGIMYQYNNEPENLEILSGNPNEIAHRISKELRDKKNDLSVVISGVDEFWDVALLKFIYEFTASSQNSSTPDITTERSFFLSLSSLEIRWAISFGLPLRISKFSGSLLY